MLLTILMPYLSAFLSIFIAINAFGKIPSFLVLMERLSHKQKKRITWQSLLYAFATTILFALMGKLLFWITGVTAFDVKIAGGILLLVLSVNVILRGSVMRTSHTKKLFPDLGIFPLVTPLIAGPELFTLSLIIFNNFGILILTTSLIVNMVFAWLVLENSDIIIKLIGEKGTAFFSKFAEIVLSVIAIMAIRQGIAETFFH